MKDDNKENHQMMQPQDVQASGKPLSLEINDAISNYIIDSVKKAFKTTLGLDVFNSAQERTDKSLLDNDYNAILCMSQEGFEARLSISFPKEILTFMLKDLYPEENLGDPKIFKDSAEEMINIIYGLIKYSLNNVGYNFKTAIPAGIIGKNNNFQQLHKSENLRIPFWISGMTSQLFYVNLAFKNNGK